MEAKDTVMRASELGIILGEVLARKGISTTADTDFDLANACLNYLSPRVDRIFKDGRRSMLDGIKAGHIEIDDVIDSLCQEAITAAQENGKHSRDSEVAEARKAGIKEVVKSLSLKPIQLGHDIFLMAEIKKETWQAQLKEWGIKEE